MSRYVRQKKPGRLIEIDMGHGVSTVVDGSTPEGRALMVRYRTGRRRAWTTEIEYWKNRALQAEAYIVARVKLRVWTAAALFIAGVVVGWVL